MSVTTGAAQQSVQTSRTSENPQQSLRPNVQDLSPQYTVPGGWVSYFGKHVLNCTQPADISQPSSSHAEGRSAGGRAGLSVTGFQTTPHANMRQSSSSHAAGLDTCANSSQVSKFADMSVDEILGTKGKKRCYVDDDANDAANKRATVPTSNVRGRYYQDDLGRNRYEDEDGKHHFVNNNGSIRKTRVNCNSGGSNANHGGRKS